MDDVTLMCGDVRSILPKLAAGSVQCVVTSPPYWGLRQYLPGVVKIRQGLSPELVAKILEELKTLSVSQIELTGGGSKI